MWAVTLGHYERIGKFTDDSVYRQYALTGLGFKYREPLFTGANPFCDRDVPDKQVKQEKQEKQGIPEMPVTEDLATHTFMMAPCFKKLCRELGDLYIRGINRVGI